MKNRIFLFLTIVLVFLSCSKEDDNQLKYGDEYQGGIFFYRLKEGDIGYVSGETHGLIASFEDLSTSEGEFEVPWGCCDEDPNSSCLDIVDAENNSIGTGLENTRAILTVCQEGDIAARLCDEYSVEFEGIVYDDWYLPSSMEIRQMHRPKKTILPEFTEYWTSSQEKDANPTFKRKWALTVSLLDDQCSPPYGYEEACYYSIENIGEKHVLYKVRAVRSF